MGSERKEIKEFERILKAHSLVKTYGGAVFLRQMFFVGTSENYKGEIQLDRKYLSEETNLGITTISNYNRKFNGTFFNLRYGSTKNIKGMEHLCFYEVNHLFYKENFDCAWVRRRLETRRKLNNTNLDNVKYKVRQSIVQTCTIENPNLDSHITEETFLETFLEQNNPLPPYEGGDVLSSKNSDEKKNPKNKKVTTKSEKSDSRFPEWYALYPRKVAVETARKAFSKIEQTFPDQIHHIIEKTKSYAQKVLEEKTESKFIAHPATWLNGHRWEDEELKNFTELEKPLTEEERKQNTLREIWLECYGTMDGFEERNKGK